MAKWKGTLQIKGEYLGLISLEEGLAALSGAKSGITWRAIMREAGAILLAGVEARLEAAALQRPTTGETTGTRARKFLEYRQRVRNLQTRLANAKTPEQRARLQELIQDASAEAAQRLSNQKGSNPSKRSGGGSGGNPDENRQALDEQINKLKSAVQASYSERYGVSWASTDVLDRIPIKVPGDDARRRAGMNPSVMPGKNATPNILWRLLEFGAGQTAVVKRLLGVTKVPGGDGAWTFGGVEVLGLLPGRIFQPHPADEKEFREALRAAISAQLRRAK